MNQIYPKFLSSCLQSLLGGIGTAEVPALHFWAVTTGYVYDSDHQVLADVPVPTRLAKSVVVEMTVDPTATVLIPEIVDAFDRTELTDVGGLILVAEFVEDTILIAYMNLWDNTGIPFTAPAQINISFVNNFLFRLGNIGPISGGAE